MIQPVYNLIEIDEFRTRNIPISFDNNEPLSVFSDNLWDLSPHIENKNCNRSDMQIEFSLFFSDGSNLVDSKYSELLLSVKSFLYARMTRPHHRTGKVLKPRSLVGLWFRLRSLLRWMQTNDILCFSQIDPESANKYWKFLGEQGLKPNTIGKKISVLEMLFHYSKFYLRPITSHPWPSETSVSLSGDKKEVSKQTLAMPQSVFSKLGSISLSLIEEREKKTISAHEECCDILRGYRSVAIQRLKSGKTKPVVREFEFQVEYCSVRALRPRLVTVANKYGFKTYGELNDAVDELHTACYIVCALFSGMRDSELSSLEIGAFFSRRGMDGNLAHWLKGFTYKIEESSRETEWMVPECVGQATSLLERITKFHRECLIRQLENMPTSGADKNNNRYNEINSWKKSLFLVKGSKAYAYRSMENNTINLRLRKFCNKNGIVDDSGNTWPISTHQFRRTFAVYVAKNTMGDLRYLRHHFKHWSMDMTLYYARHQSGDNSLISEIMTERDKINRIIVSDWLSGSTSLSGGRGHAITAFKRRNMVKTADSLDDAIGKLADGMFIRATGHSWCLSNGDSCGGQGLYDSLPCTSCDSSVIDSTHLPIWKGIKKQQEQILQLNDIGVSVKHHAKKQIEAAEQIIETLENE